jgi:hypothetical protein
MIVNHPPHQQLIQNRKQTGSISEAFRKQSGSIPEAFRKRFGSAKLDFPRRKSTIQLPLEKKLETRRVSKGEPHWIIHSTAPSLTRRASINTTRH